VHLAAGERPIGRHVEDVAVQLEAVADRGRRARIDTQHEPIAGRAVTPAVRGSIHLGRTVRGGESG
jgi:hypothetical protein